MSGYSIHSVRYGSPLKLRQYLHNVLLLCTRFRCRFVQTHLVFQVFGDHAFCGRLEGMSKNAILIFFIVYVNGFILVQD
ncbi:hypothetical protein JR316_0007473 [Psilocybe cubensis]|uniref:Uncharacterized protein n=1 Tax=Psilocybe cubensis TaxID=181762 RepID=A0ACB8GZ62_PSICU|nr:hypothetical protein JR316_0007473 [Psilocybe cubensis]KAH9480871.1 hypothetical protein JR316_0007473 [Psilocybe cubensis]